MHLIVLQHGLWGNITHMEPIEKMILESHSNKDIQILNIKENEGNFSYDGVDVCGDRCVSEIEKATEANTINKISFIGYSLGGLILRYAIGRLYAKGYFKKVKPINYISLATPHLGTPKPPKGKRNVLFNNVQRMILTRVGDQFTITDNYLENSPLLVVMSDPKLPFHKGLALFDTLSCFANIQNDRSVRFTTGCIELSNPYTRFQSKVIDLEYPSIVTYNKDQKFVPRKTTYSDILVWTLVPVIVPIWFVVASIGLGIASHKASYRQSLLEIDSTWVTQSKFNLHENVTANENQTDREEAENDANVDFGATENIADIFEDSTDDSVEPRSSLNVNRDANRVTMITNLNFLNWKKHNVKFDGMNAHAAIVMRGPYNKIEYNGVLRFMLERVFKFE